MAKIKFIRLPGLPKTPIGDNQGGGALTPEQEAAITANTSARHTHQNKSVLDGITAEKIAAWDGKANPSDIPSLTGYATETWVEGKGYQTASDVQTAIAAALTAPFEIPITRSGSTYTTTVTAEEIREHADNCVIVYGNLTFDKTVVSVDGQTVSVNTAVVSLSADKTYAIYTTISVSVDANDAVTVAFRQKQENFLPDKTNASVGDFLRLDANKNAVWETVPSVMGASIPLGN